VDSEKHALNLILKNMWGCPHQRMTPIADKVGRPREADEAKRTREIKNGNETKRVVTVRSGSWALYG
jgi:hypothetical protein